MLNKSIALLVAPLLVSAPLENSIELGFEGGTSFLRTIESKGELVLEFAMVVNDEEQDMGAEPIDLAYSETQKFRDTIQSLGDGRPTKIERTHEELIVERTIETPEETIEEELTSPLTGEVAIFTWSDEDSEWSVAQPEDAETELEEDILNDLRPDLDLLGLLPDGEVSVDDEWDVGGELYHCLSWPGGIMTYLFEEQEERDELEADLSRQRYDNVEATGKAKLVSVEDGVATIEVKLEATTEAEVEIEVEEAEEGPTPEVSRTQEAETELEITITWDLEAGHWTSVSMSDTTTMQIDESAKFDMEGEEFTMVQSRSFEGEIQIEWTNEVVK